MIDISIKIGGAAGQGLQTMGEILGKALVRGGYHVLGVQDTMSRVRGGHNTFQIRVKDGPVAAMRRGVDLLVAMDRRSLDVDAGDLVPGGISVGDGAALDVSFERIAAAETGKKVAANAVALGAVSGLLGFGEELPLTLLGEALGKPELAAGNARAFRAGYEAARRGAGGTWTRDLAPRSAPRRMLLTGNEAICLGAIAAGCRFMSAYPMSPSTSIITYLAGKGDRVGLVTEQAEDEIAAVSMALGAAAGGVRAMVATSGGGLALMVETVSMLGVGEVPLVLVDCQRPGPATGLATKTEQADLLFVIHAGHGEFPRAVLAPGDAASAFAATVQAFNLADEHQIPVFLLADQYLADSIFTCDPFDLAAVPRATSLLDDAALAAMQSYSRYAVTGTGVSPRAFPGQSAHLVMTDSHEHDEHGHITEDAGVRRIMNDKRLAKVRGLSARMPGLGASGPADARTVLVGFGSTLGAMAEASEVLAGRGVRTRVVHFGGVWPFPAEEAAQALRGAEEIIAVEGNATGQLASLIRAHTDHRDVRSILKYDGRPFLVEDIVDEFEKGGVSG